MTKPYLPSAPSLPHTQGNGLGCAGVEALVQALRRPGCADQLRYLGLAANGIGESGGCSLAGWLGSGVPVPLQTIELRDNSLGDRAAAALAAMLVRNRQLQNLSLLHNAIGHDGARALAEARSKYAVSTVGPYFSTQSSTVTARRHWPRRAHLLYSLTAV